jgi:hypothetical protein
MRLGLTLLGAAINRASHDVPLRTHQALAPGHHRCLFHRASAQHRAPNFFEELRDQVRVH